MMRAAVAFLVVLTTAGVSPAAAQADFYGRFGVTFATKLLKDDILQEIDVQQSLAPTLALGVSLPFTPQYSAGLEAAITSSGFHSSENSSDTDLGTLRTGSLMLGLEGPLWQRVHWRAGAGLISYLPSEDSGIFLQGGTTRFLVGAGLDYRYPVMSHWDLMASLRYDFHRFTTDELVLRGFSGTQGVQRVSASIGLARGHR
jgi:hypothetical protein